MHLLRFHIAIFCVISHALAGQPVQSPVTNTNSGGAVTGTNHSGTSVPTHISVIGQHLFMPRNTGNASGAGVLNVNEIMFSTLVTISDFNPKSGSAGTTVTITGTNFSTTPGNNIVRFNNRQATVTSSTTTSIVATVPDGATTGKVTVTVAGVVATSSDDYMVLARIISENLPASYDKGATITASIVVDDASKLSSVVFKRRGISGDPDDETSSTVSPTLNTYQIQVPAGQLTDELGLRYYFLLNHPNSTTSTGTVRYAYLHYPDEQSNTIPALSFGGKLSNYQLISIPITLDNKSVPAVFDELMPYDKTEWRLFDYANGSNREYPLFTNIDQGKGYWLIVKDQTMIDIGGGSVRPVTEVDPFPLALHPGWNLIGNPYNFAISWTDVLAANGNPSSIDTQVKLFSAGALSLGDKIDRFRGAFVKNHGSSVVNLDVPVRRNTSIGRMHDQQVRNGLDEPHWEVQVTVHEGDLRNHLGGVGMHPDAIVGHDRFDEASVPFPEDIGFPALHFHTQRGTLSKAIVNYTGNFTWSFDLSRYSKDATLELAWSNEYFGSNDRHLMLYEPGSGDWVDMRDTESFVVKPESRKLEFVFGNKQYVEEFIEAQLPWLGDPYPNPSKAEIKIPFRVPAKADNQHVKISVFNAQGLELTPLIGRVLRKGYYELNWYPETRPALYLLRMTIGEEEVAVKKVILH